MRLGVRMLRVVKSERRHEVITDEAAIVKIVVENTQN